MAENAANIRNCPEACARRPGLASGGQGHCLLHALGRGIVTSFPPTAATVRAVARVLVDGTMEHPGFHAHMVLCDAASPGGSAVTRLPGLEPGPGFVQFPPSSDYRTPVHLFPAWHPGTRQQPAITGPRAARLPGQALRLTAQDRADQLRATAARQPACTGTTKRTGQIFPAPPRPRWHRRGTR